MGQTRRSWSKKAQPSDTLYFFGFGLFVQSIGITATFHTLSQAKLVATPNTKTYLLIGAILTTGSMIVTWLGEQITDKGYGNGVSMIIFAGIVSSIPEMIKEIYENAFVNVRLWSHD